VPAAIVVTVLILITAFASVYGNLLGFSRVPYAAAVDGAFWRAFAHLDARGRFPDVALLVIGLLALPACFFSLDAAIAWLTTGTVIIGPLAQIAAVFVMRARGQRSPFRMWWYPLPAAIALVGWLFVFASAGASAIAFGLLSLGTGIAAFLIGAKMRTAWPFAAQQRT
jgi:amino acid transporter